MITIGRLSSIASSDAVPDASRTTSLAAIASRDSPRNRSHRTSGACSSSARAKNPRVARSTRGATNRTSGRRRCTQRAVRARGSARRRSSLIRLPGRSATVRARRSRPSRSRGRVPAGTHRDLVGERMPHEPHRDGPFLVERGLERKQREHHVHRPRDLREAVASPCPDRRADEVNRLHAGATQRELQREVEIRSIHADERIGWILGESPGQAPSDRNELQVAPGRLGETHDRQALHRIHGIDSRGRACADRQCLRTAPPAPLRESLRPARSRACLPRARRRRRRISRPITVTAAPHRTIPRPEDLTKSRKRLTSADSFAGPTSCSTAASSVRPRL